ncbi:MAG: glycosyltransferase [Clostridium sp.]|nr:glycosyltransferase [Clostridium sp.]
MDISIVLPAYQEAENLKSILPRLQKVLEKKDLQYEILVIDTMTPMDDSKKICEENNVCYIPRKNGNLYGDAIRTGFSKGQGKFLVVMDADGSHNPEDVLRFYDEMEKGKYNLIIGSRYCKGGYTDNNFILRFMSYVLNLTYRMLFGLRVKDVSDSFRMYRTEDLRKITLECDNFDIVEEILIKLHFQIGGFTVKEIPISFSKRVAGESKRDLVKFIFSYLQTISKLMKIKRNIRSGK